MARERVIFIGDDISKRPRAAYKDIIQPYSEKWDTDIAFCLCHGDAGFMPSDIDFDKMYLFIQLVPEDTEGVTPAHIDSFKINGKEIVLPIKNEEDGEGNSTPKCPQGSALSYTKLPTRAVEVTDDDGKVIAIYEDNSIFFLTDAIHARSQEELAIGKEVVEYVLNKILDGSDFIKNLKAGQEQKSRRALEKTLKKSYKEQLVKEETVLKASQDTIDSYVKGIVDCEKKIMTRSGIVEAIRSNLSDMPTALDKVWSELDRMQEGRMYEKVSIQKNRLEAITRDIHITWNKRFYKMGAYKIVIDLSNGNTNVGNVNPGNARGNYPHPHVNSGGNVCWGNFAGQIPSLIGSCQFDVALTMLHTFLCAYDKGAPYHTMEHWDDLIVDKIEEYEKKVNTPSEEACTAEVASESNHDGMEVEF